MVADPNHDSAEFAILVIDAWQGKGVGELLTETCVEIAKAWGLRRVTGHTSPENSRMIAILQKLGFGLRRDMEEGVVYLEKELG
jgi:acetyltransferase